MPSSSSPLPMLLKHFFRRFLDNDTLQVEGDTLTTLARALAVVLAPGLLVAFFLQNQYPQRDLRGRMEDQYFFVLFSFVVMGLITVFEWEMLFPDRADFLVLTPLPLHRWQLMLAKALALGGFFLVFLIASNVLGALVYPAICGQMLFRQIVAHTAAVSCAGLFSCCAILATVGLLRCTLPDRYFRIATPLLQMILTAALGLLVIGYARYSHTLLEILTHHVGTARWLPPLWFLGLYEELLYGGAAPAFAPVLCRVALGGYGAALALIVAFYPLAWQRTQHMAIEGGLRPARAPSMRVAGLVHAVVQRPAERAMFHFTGQTLRRGSRYQVYLAMYGGTGVALALACAFVLREGHGRVTPTVSGVGFHAVLPLLTFWIVAGLHAAFGFPTNLGARWVFRISGADKRSLATAAYRWTLAMTWMVLGCTLLLFRATDFPWSPRHLLVQLAAALCLSVLVADAFFIARRIPFTEPRLPGKSNFALFLTLYVGVLTPGLFGIVWAELRMEQNLRLLLPLLTVTALSHLLFHRMRQSPMEVEEQMEGYDGAFQLLNLG